MTWLEKITDPDLLRSLPLGEKAITSLYMALLGMGVTFIALGIVWGVVVIFTKILRATPTRRKFEPPPAPAVKPLFLLEEDDEAGEVVAVIVSALAVTREVAAAGIRVKTIRLIEDLTPSWGKVGRIEQLNS